MDTVYVVLLIIFIVIFLATAAITICALPGWIKIPNNYLKILFSSLLLEVIACIFMVFRYQQSFQEQKQKAQVYCKENHWVILNEKGQLSQLSIDSAIVSSDIDNFTLQAREYANYSIIKENGEYLIKNRDNKYIGKVPEKILRDSLGLFNEINLEDSDFERVTFIKSNNNWVTKNGKNVPKKWSLRLNINKVQDVDTSYYNENVGDFDANKRIFHTFRGSDGAHYIVRISDANLSSEASEPFVTFMIIRTAIVSKLN